MSVRSIPAQRGKAVRDHGGTVPLGVEARGDADTISSPSPASPPNRLPRRWPNCGREKGALLKRVSKFPIKVRTRRAKKALGGRRVWSDRSKQSQSPAANLGADGHWLPSGTPGHRRAWPRASAFWRNLVCDRPKRRGGWTNGEQGRVWTFTSQTW